MDSFKFEHNLHFTEERYVSLFGAFRKKTRPLRIAALGMLGLACLFSPYTLVIGVFVLFFSIFGIFILRWIPKSAVHVYRNSPYLHDPLTYGVDHRCLWLVGPLIEARVPWAAATVWARRDGWLRITAVGAPLFWFPIDELKRAGVYEPVMKLCKQHAAQFNAHSGNK